MDSFARAKEAGLKYEVLTEVLAYRRLRRNSLSSQQRHAKDLIKVSKAVLDRKRIAVKG